MTIAKSLNQKKNKITHESTHRSKQTNTKSANIKINKKIVKICSKFKVDNCTQVRLSFGWILLVKVVPLVEVGCGGGGCK